MRTQIGWIGTLFWMLMSTIVAVGQDDVKMLTFENAFQMMYDQNPALQRAREEVKQKEFERSMKQGLYMPRVSIGANAVTMSDKLHLDLTDVGDALSSLYGTLGNYGVFSDVPYVDPTTGQVLTILSDENSTAAVRAGLLEGQTTIDDADWDVTIQDKTFATVTADFIWPVFTGGKIKGANKAAEVQTEISRQELRQKEGELLSELVTRYYGMVLAVQASQVREQMYKAMDHHYSDAQKLFDGGMIAKVQYLHASVARNEAERELKQSKRNIEIIKAGLVATLAVDRKENVLPASHLFLNKELPDLDFWISKAMESNPQLQQIDGKKDLVDIKNWVGKGEYLPTVAMMGTYNLVDKNLSAYVPDWLVGVGLKWSVFEGLSRNKQLKADLTLTDQVKYVQEKANADIAAYLTKLYQEMNMQMEQVEELESTLGLAQEYYSSTEKAFNEGFATSALVVDAYTKVTQVKIMRLKVFYDYDVTLSTLLQVAGIPERFTNYCSGENTLIEYIKE